MNDSHASRHSAESPIAKSTAALRNIDPKWLVELGIPDTAQDAHSGWIRGTDFARGREGPLPALLNRIGERLKTDDRLTIAASFSLRFGWASWVAIVPYVVNRCVPEIGLHNISLKFGANTLHERTAIHVPSGTVLSGQESSAHPLIRSAEDSVLLQLLRSQLLEQTRPIVDALYDWSGFSKKGAWGQITSSWTSHFISAYGRLGGVANALPVLGAFFGSEDDEINGMQPKITPLSLGNQTHLYQRRASCCRYYLLPQGSLCTSCPLVTDNERLVKNLDWMRERASQGNG